MKRPHKIAAAAGAPLLTVLLAWGLQCWTAYQTAARNHEEWKRFVAACEARGGMLWKGDCKTFPANNWREPK